MVLVEVELVVEEMVVSRRAGFGAVLVLVLVLVGVRCTDRREVVWARGLVASVDVSLRVPRDVAILAVLVVGGRLEVVTGSVELVSAWVDDDGAVVDVVEVGGAELEVEGCAPRRRASAIG